LTKCIQSFGASARFESIWNPNPVDTVWKCGSWLTISLTTVVISRYISASRRLLQWKGLVRGSRKTLSNIYRDPAETSLSTTFLLISIWLKTSSVQKRLMLTPKTWVQPLESCQCHDGTCDIRFSYPYPVKGSHLGLSTSTHTALQTEYSSIMKHGPGYNSCNFNDIAFNSWDSALTVQPTVRHLELRKSANIWSCQTKRFTVAEKLLPHLTWKHANLYLIFLSLVAKSVYSWNRRNSQTRLPTSGFVQTELGIDMNSTVS